MQQFVKRISPWFPQAQYKLQVTKYKVTLVTRFSGYIGHFYKVTLLTCFSGYGHFYKVTLVT